jgi:hypothetical protein
MLADFFTKPVQGALFKKFRDVILGYQPLDYLSESPTSTFEERVGESDMKQTVDAETSGRAEPRTYADVVRSKAEAGHGEEVDGKTVKRNSESDKRVTFA